MGSYQLFIIILSLEIWQAVLESDVAKCQLLDSGELKSMPLATCAAAAVREQSVCASNSCGKCAVGLQTEHRCSEIQKLQNWKWL